MQVDYDNYLASLIRGNRGKCHEILLKRISSGDSILDIYTNFFQTSLYDIGELWQQNKVSVAVEHMATAITESLLGYIYPLILQNEKNGKIAVVSCCTEELHQVGARIVADYFEIIGWDAHFLGSNTPLNDLITFIDATNPDVIGLSISIYSNIQHLRTCLTELTLRFPETPVLLGGQAFRWGGRDIVSDFPNATIIDSLHELKKYLNVKDDVA